MTEDLQQIWKKNDKLKTRQDIFKILLFGLILGLTNYAFEFFEDYSSTYYETQKIAIEKKNINSKNLKSIKDYTKESNSILYNQYISDYKEFQTAKKDFKEKAEEEKFLGFKSVYFFMDRFGKNTKSFLFGVWVFYVFLITFRTTSKWIFIARITVVVIFLSTTVFDFFWIFNKLQDLSKFSYYLMTLFISSSLILCLFLILKDKKSYEEKIRENMLKIAEKSILMSSKENRKEMVEFIKTVATKN